MDNEVFRALADPSRRTLLDRLFERDGQTTRELEAALGVMTRFGVMKHLRVLEGANLVTSRKVGRERHHYLNPVPIRRIHDRWLDRYAIRAADLLADLKITLEIDPMTSPDTASPAATGVETAPRHVFAGPLAHCLGRDRGQSYEGLADMVLPSQHRFFVQRLRESRKQLGQNPSHQIEHRGGRFDCQTMSTCWKQQQ